jgi:hypothetical protein
MSQKTALSHRYSASGSRFREATIEAGWLCFNNGAVSIRIRLPLLTRLELAYQMRDWLLGLALVGFFVGMASMGLRWLGWLDIPHLLRINPQAFEFGALALAVIACISYFLFPIRVLYLHDGGATPVVVVGNKKAIEEMEYVIWAFLEALHKKQP